MDFGPRPHRINRRSWMGGRATEPVAPDNYLLRVFAFAEGRQTNTTGIGQFDVGHWQLGGL
eukprot:1183473-Lingulodinium_polyedra.AAC.1